MGSTVPKVLLSLNGQSVLERTLGPFLALNIRCIVMVASEQLEHVGVLVSRFPSVHVAIGGATRAESVRNGLATIEATFKPAPDSVVLVHDAARCLVDRALIERVVVATREAGAAIPGLPVTDTLKQVSSTGCVDRTIDRSKMVAVQTPQGFHFSLLQRAYQSDNLLATDDASLVEQFSAVQIVDGERSNIKLTYPEDLEFAQMWLARGAEKSSN